MIDNLYSALKRRRCGRAVTSESGSCRAADGGAPAALPASPLRSEAANAAEEVLALLVLIKVRFLSPPYSNCPGSTCLTHVGTVGTPTHHREFAFTRLSVQPDHGLHALWSDVVRRRKIGVVKSVSIVGLHPLRDALLVSPSAVSSAHATILTHYAFEYLPSEPLSSARCSHAVGYGHKVKTGEPFSSGVTVTPATRTHREDCW